MGMGNNGFHQLHLVTGMKAAASMQRIIQAACWDSMPVTNELSTTFSAITHLQRPYEPMFLFGDDCSRVERLVKVVAS
jgi:hypothetical protein